MEIEESMLQDREKVLAVRYENLLTNPENTVENILNHISAPADTELVSSLTESIDASRAFAFKQDSKLVEFAEQNSGVLEKFGY